MSLRLSLPKPALLALSAIALIVGALMATGCGGSSSAPAAVDSSGSANAPCSRTFSSLTEVQGAVAKAAAHAVICLEDGDYGKLSLDAGTRPTRVIVRAEHPAGATIEGAELAGDNLTLAGFVSTSGIQVSPGRQASRSNTTASPAVARASKPGPPTRPRSTTPRSSATS